MTNRKSNLLILAAFFTVMSTMLLFILLVQNKALIHWVSLLFILLAEFVFFIAQLYWEMTMDDRRKPSSRKLIRTYFLVSVLLSLSFLFTGFEKVRFLSITQLILLVGVFSAMLLINRRPIEHFAQIDYQLKQQFEWLSDHYVHTMHSEKLKQLSDWYSDEYKEKADLAFRLKSLAEALRRGDEGLIQDSIAELERLLSPNRA